MARLAICSQCGQQNAATHAAGRCREAPEETDRCISNSMQRYRDTGFAPAKTDAMVINEELGVYHLHSSQNELLGAKPSSSTNTRSKRT